MAPCVSCANLGSWAVLPLGTGSNSRGPGLMGVALPPSVVGLRATTFRP